jgi:hypothetical protein
VARNLTPTFRDSAPRRGPARAQSGPIREVKTLATAVKETPLAPRHMDLGSLERGALNRNRPGGPS